ncbi:hypothetical protein IMSAGC004_01170 [Bacteroidaceae bacterium]|nr:hypothetical protein IMSAGC004_01170 [Bacteroidaceae bacterium]
METIHYLHSPGKTTSGYFLHAAGHIKCDFLYLVALTGIYFEKHIDNILCFSPPYNSYNGTLSTMLVPIGKDCI